MTIEDIALQMTPGIGIKGAVHLLELFGDARSIFAATADELVAKPTCVPTRRSRSSAGRDFRPPKRISPTVAATTLRPSPPPTRNTRRCCAKSPIIPT